MLARVLRNHRRAPLILHPVGPSRAMWLSVSSKEKQAFNGRFRYHMIRGKERTVCLDVRMHDHKSTSAAAPSSSSEDRQQQTSQHRSRRGRRSLAAQQRRAESWLCGSKGKRYLVRGFVRLESFRQGTRQETTEGDQNETFSFTISEFDKPSFPLST